MSGPPWANAPDPDVPGSEAFGTDVIIIEAASTGAAGPVTAGPGDTETERNAPAAIEAETADSGPGQPGPAETVAGPGESGGSAAEPGPAGTEPARGGLARAGPPALSARLTALARLIQIGTARSDGSVGAFSKELLEDSEELLARAGERLRLSADHTVVALAGGTGSGKSSLFNRLSAAELSTVGVTRPVTRDAHACVWGVTGSGPLLDWLGVPVRFRYPRGSALDRGEEAMTGLVLLDLPDHDSVVTAASDQVDRLVGLADLIVWVLDPQKYADGAVHEGYLVPLARHSEVMAVVLNQSDLLTAGELEDCAADLRRLLESEGLHDIPILTTSAVTGAGLDELRKLLMQTVSERRAASARISADLDDIAARFAPYAGVRDARDRVQPDGAGTVSADAAEHLAGAFARAAGTAAVGDALQSARELRAMDYVGWPVAWLAERVAGRDPVRKIRLGKLWEELRNVTAGPSGAQQADIDTALTRLADEVCPPLPAPWSQTVRAAVRSRAGQLPAALGASMGESLPPENRILRWWRLVGAWQGLLLGSVIVGLAWIVAIMIFGVFHAASNVPRLFGEVSLLPWIGVMIVAFLALGWLTASGCLNLVRSAAGRERQSVDAAMRAGVAATARDMVLTPAEHELYEYQRFRGELRVAAGGLGQEAQSAPGSSRGSMRSSVAWPPALATR
jgi:GTP-binding protein EngB required for normal cell division